jgi:RNA polymerase sigma-70 factor (ECF subfamily)
MNNFTDEQLVLAALNGQSEALGALIERYSKLVYRFVFQYVRDDADAQDVTQEVFLKVWKSLEQFEEGKTFRPWLYTIAKRTCLDLLKKHSNVAFSRLDVGALEKLQLEEWHDAGVSAQDHTERVLLGDTLLSAMKKLSPQYAEVVTLYHQHDLNLREIAEMKSEPLNTVKSRYRRALSMLKNTLSE